MNIRYNSSMKNRDAEYLEKLRDYYAIHRVLPPFTGIAKLVGLRSTATIALMVGRLKAAGYLSSSPERRLQPGRRFFERINVDHVPAGSPQTANDGLSSVCYLDQLLVRIPSRTVVLTVDGDSMEEAGMHSGDLVVVQKGAPTKPGDVVVAIVDRECTVKFLAKDKDGFYLKPGNRAYKNIRPKEELELFGKVVGLVRQYK
jgi:repressor LexA